MIPEAGWPGLKDYQDYKKRLFTEFNGIL